MEWFTSDHHFDHLTAAKKFRNFDSIDEMNQDLIAKWNGRISKKDTVYHLGDFTFGECYLDRLNGRKILIKGNHDKKISSKWDTVKDSYAEIKRFKKRIVMCHYPLKTWNGMHRGSIHLFGHSHLNKQQMEIEFCTTGAIHVGVDSWDGYPISLDEIFGMQKGEWPWNL